MSGTERPKHVFTITDSGKLRSEGRLERETEHCLFCTSEGEPAKRISKYKKWGAIVLEADDPTEAVERFQREWRSAASNLSRLEKEYRSQRSAQSEEIRAVRERHGPLIHALGQEVDAAKRQRRRCALAAGGFVETSTEYDSPLVP